MWYSVHAIYYFEDKENPEQQNEFVIWENIFLIHADSAEDAGRKGESRAQQDTLGSEDPITLNAKFVDFRFAGIRKIVECQDLDIQSGLPVDGTELSYSEFVIESKEEFEKLVDGEPAEVIYND